ncbi:hypothetical protein HGO38_19085 [Rhizobium sp. CG5]|uniref:SIR2 family protein n=1 Tax=Rhizobium sp. CG5 TaxID=2726076 RepID=UPI0020336281|nr:SIR2 family protein [Rhizobium sp. CG5]MCM2475584.1 hypothetical protein [Rhizobium sp. CG5]
MTLRFLADGPAIPDELLVARDNGRVIFFCGAGVSRARTGLPDFFGLAEAVIKELRVPATSPAHKILAEAKDIENRTGVAGLISADKLFGLLERDYLRRDIEAAVAKSLRPADNADLSAHQILLDLATAPNGRLQLVTTNFDRLFNDCKAGVECSQFPRLPDPARQGDINGIVYLHGRATASYDAAENEGFVLSSASFGRAYLSDGWAASFFKEILKRFVVVFVGYTADDPPVQYLLEALNLDLGTLEGVYAFQSGAQDEAVERWRHKGVQAIPYDPRNFHKALWDTLEAWSARARDIDGWYSAVLQKAIDGPRALAAYERGQIAHIVSTPEGAKRFANYEKVLPAEWLCVFDQSVRYSRPSHVWVNHERGPYVDPFDLYGLDEDETPKQVDPDDHYPKREVPRSAWSAFDVNPGDLPGSGSNLFSSLRGYGSTAPSAIPLRLQIIGDWITKVAHSPTAVWWAGRQLGLYPALCKRIRWELRHNEADPDIRRSWRLLFESWAHRPQPHRREWYELQEATKLDGWTSTAIRELGSISRPYLVAKLPYLEGPIPPDPETTVNVERIVRADVEYPDVAMDVSVPAELSLQLIRECRRNLEIALDLETETGGFGLDRISPINRDPDPEIDGHERFRGLSRLVLSYVKMLSAHLEIDATASRREMMTWPANDDTIFARLRIWALGKDDLVPASGFSETMDMISRGAFWSPYHQRDLLLSIKQRWDGLGATEKSEIERRICEGPSRWEEEDQEKYDERRAWAVASRIQWLASNTGGLSFDVDSILAELRTSAPNWNPDYSDRATESLEGRGGIVQKDKDTSSLKNKAASEVLAFSREASSSRRDFLVERDPFAGLVEEFPLRAFAALTHAARNNEFPNWAWDRFLSAEARKSDTVHLISLIAQRVIRYPVDSLSSIIRPLARWYETVAAKLATSNVSLFDQSFSKLVEILNACPESGGSAIIRGNKEPDWTMEAINAPVGNLVDALLEDPRKNGLMAKQGFPADWLAHVEDLLNLPGDLRRHALVIFSHQISWLDAIDPDWTRLNILPVLDGQDSLDKDAMWAGFFWAARVPNTELYQLLKPHLLRRASEQNSGRRGYNQVIAGMLLAGWASRHQSGEKLVSDQELHDLLATSDDDLRQNVIWQAESLADDKDATGPETGLNWSELLLMLLKDVWPKQKAAKSPAISSRLCDLAFSAKDNFEVMVDAILPLVSKIEGDQMFSPLVGSSEDTVVERFPSKTLELLFAVLPENAKSWPYGTAGALKRIGEAEPFLKTDVRMLELLRRLEFG